MKKRLIPLLASSLFSLCTCSTSAQAFSRSAYAFDTVVNYTLYGEENTEAFSSILSLIQKYDKLFDSYKAYDGISNVYTINNSDSPVEVGLDLYEALKTAYDYIDKTEGYFNPLIGNLSDAWKASLENGKVLSDSEVSRYLNEMNSSSLIFDDETHSVGISGDASLDLGAFAKGYVLSEIRNYLVNEASLENYLIDAGSSSVLLGTKPKVTDFNVGIKYLNNAYLKESNTSVGTSAVREQYYEIDGVTYSHIINPFTGSAVSNYDFVMVINEDPTLTDVLSTSMMSMDIDTIKKFETEYGVQVIVSKDKEILYKSEDVEVLYHQ